MHRYQRFSRRFCVAEGQRIAYAVLGQGPPLLLIHGLGGTADFWHPLTFTLARRYTLLCPDLLGFGFSDKPRGAYTPERLASGVRAVLHDAGLHHLHAMIAHSVGGVVASVLLATSSCTTTRLALVATPYPSLRFPIQQELIRSRFDRLLLERRPVIEALYLLSNLLWPLVRHVPVPLYLQGAFAGIMDNTAWSYVSTTQECLLNADLDPLLPALQHYPTLLLYGLRDQTVPPSHGERLHTMLPASRYQTIDSGHYGVLQEGILPLSNWLNPGLRNPDGGTGQGEGAEY